MKRQLISLGLVGIFLVIPQVLSADKDDYKKEMRKLEKERSKEYKERGKSESKRQDIYKNKHKNGSYDSYEKYDRKPHYEEGYPGKGKSDSEYIEEKVDQTKKNWIDKVFDVFN